MTNTLTTSEIKRRGMAAIEQSLQKGPVHITKRNKAAAVILSEADYQQLLDKRAARTQQMTAVQWLLSCATEGNLNKADIDARLSEERGW